MKNAAFKRISIAVLALCGFAMNVSAGTFAHITIDGSFSDWEGVPVLATAPTGTSGTNLDLASVSIANDESNIYLLVTYNTPVNPNAGPSVFLAFDTDNHPATGFDVLGLGLMGSEVGWQNDFPFAQSNGVFNSGTISNGAALIAPFFSVTTTQEYAISRFALYTASGQPVFPGATVTLMVYANPTPNTDVLGPVQYTFATNTPAGTYAHITVDGNFSDWAGVPVLATLAPGTSGTNLDLATLAIANDSSNLYLRITYQTPVNPNAGPSVFVAVDNDSNPATGFDVYGLGLLGSEVAWQNDFPFAQSNGVFNSGSISGGNAVIAPYYSVTTTQEYAISRSATFATNGQTIFPNNSFKLLVYADPTLNSDLLGPVSYTFVTNTLPGTYGHITVDGDFSDWTNVPVVFTGLPGDGSPVGVRTIQMANDESNIYLRLTYYTTVNPNAGGVFLAFDTDNNTGTGFDVYGLGEVGSEAGWQNDTPFAQSNGVFNAGGITGGSAAIAPYNVFASAQEYAIPRSATYTGSGTPVFPGSSFTLLVYTTSGTPDISGPVHYTFAAAPGPRADFRVLSLKRQTNDISVTWIAPGGTTNLVQATNGAKGSYSNSFVDISSQFINPGAASVAVTNSYVDSFGATNAPGRYYRVRQAP